MTGPSGHLDLDALADVLAGERTGERHLRSCATCSERLAELAGAEVAVVASLATLPSPALPEGLAERLTSALRAEAEAGSADQPVGTQAARVLPLRRRRPAAWLPAAAAAVALVLAGGVALSTLPGAGAPEGASSEAVGGGTAEDAGTDEALADLSAQPGTSGTDYADAAQRTAAVARLLTGAATAAPSASEDTAHRGSTGTSGSTFPAPALGAGPADVPVLDRLNDPAALAECLAALRADGSPSAAPLALDLALFEGAPALAVLQPDADPGRLVLTVAGPGCSGADPDTLLRTRVDRP